MNNRGQMVLVGVMISVVLFIMIVSLIEPIKDQARAARTSLSCSGTNLTASEEATCIVTDSYLFAFVGVGIAVALGWIGMKTFGAGAS